MLNRVREKSQEQAIRRKKSQEEKNNSDSDSDKKKILKSSHTKNELLISTNINSLEIKPISQINYENQMIKTAMSPLNSLRSLNNHRLKFEEEDEQLISILNSNCNKNLITSQRKQCDLKDSTIDAKADFYDDNLFDLIDDMESKEEFFKQKKEIQIKNEKKPDLNLKMNIDYAIHKE
jgi:hypothetical protein